jgi:hypothetical protein
MVVRLPTSSHPKCRERLASLKPHFIFPRISIKATRVEFKLPLHSSNEDPAIVTFPRPRSLRTGAMRPGWWDKVGSRGIETIRFYDSKHNLPIPSYSSVAGGMLRSARTVLAGRTYCSVSLAQFRTRWTDVCCARTRLPWASSGLSGFETTTRGFPAREIIGIYPNRAEAFRG